MNKQLVVLTFAAFGAFMLNASAAGVADLHAAKGQDCAACHMEGKPSSSNVSEASCQKCHGEEPAGKALEIEEGRQHSQNPFRYVRMPSVSQRPLSVRNCLRRMSQRRTKHPSPLIT